MCRSFTTQQPLSASCLSVCTTLAMANRSTPPNGGTIGLLAIQLLAGKWRQQSRLALLKGLRRAFVLAFEHHNPAVSFVRKPPFEPTDRNPFF